MKKFSKKRIKKRLEDAICHQDIDKMVAILNSFDVDINEYDMFGRNAAMDLLFGGKQSSEICKAVEMLYTKGLRVDYLDTNGRSIFYYIAYSFHQQTLTENEVDLENFKKIITKIVQLAGKLIIPSRDIDYLYEVKALSLIKPFQECADGKTAGYLEDYRIILLFE